MSIKKQIEKLISKIDGAEVSICKNEKLGDYTIATFKCKGAEQEILKVLDPKNSIGLISSVSVVGPYINIFVNEKEAFELYKKEPKSLNNIGKGQTVCLDFSSVNVAKQMHIGHLGTTAIGNSLALIHKALGYNVVRINYLGDYGTQFGILVLGVKMFGCNLDSLEEINALYVKMNKLVDEDKELFEKAKEQSALIESGDKENCQIYNKIKKTTIDDVLPLYEKLNIKFDDWNGEEYYSHKCEDVKKLMLAKGLLEDEKGALVIDLGDDNKKAIFRSDGASVYITRDIATILDRKEKYKYAKNIYVVATEQNLHFKNLFAIMEKIEPNKFGQLKHVAYGMVRLTTGAISTRSGNVLKLSDVINTAIEKASERTSNKDVANQVAIGAVLFSTLCNERLRDVVFDFNKVLSFEGETAPYIQYTNARINSILEKSGKAVSVSDYQGFKPLIKLLDSFNATVVKAAEDCEPCYISRLLLDISAEFNKFYANFKVAENAERIELCKMVQSVLQKGLGLLGISAPHKM